MFPKQGTVLRLGVVFAILIVLVLSISPPKLFEPGLLTIENGMTMQEVAELLENRGVVYSDTLVRTVSFIRRGDGLVQAGDYYFKEPLGAWSAVLRLVHGDFGVEIVRIRLPEGSTRRQMAGILDGLLPNFNTRDFLDLTSEKEGYLFPDTYFFFQTASTQDVVDRLVATFNKRINDFSEEISESEHSLNDIITMASIIDREAYKPEDQKIISGVLWKRIDLGMALQVDASLYYLLGKTSSQLTKDDLKTDSPYNTYKYSGLPPGPISNPSISAIQAALRPTDSEYLYYLSDKDGVTHYAIDFEEHKENKVRYLY